MSYAYWLDVSFDACAIESQLIGLMLTADGGAEQQ